MSLFGIAVVDDGALPSNLTPFILFKRKTIIILLFFSILLRLYLIKIGVGLKDPWTYRFFPTELAFFLTGALSNQIIFSIKFMKLF